MSIHGVSKQILKWEQQFYFLFEVKMFRRVWFKVHWSYTRKIKKILIKIFINQLSKMSSIFILLILVLRSSSCLTSTYYIYSPHLKSEKCREIIHFFHPCLILYSISHWFSLASVLVNHSINMLVTFYHMLAKILIVNQNQYKNTHF